MNQEISYESAVSKEFRKKFSKRSVRPASLDDLKFLAKKYFLSEELPASYRASAMVVFIYKCLETNDFDSLAEIDSLYEEILLVLKESFSESYIGLREDSQQQYISLLTASVHLGLLRRDHVSVGLCAEKILDVAAGGKVHPNYALNVSNAFLMRNWSKFSVSGDLSDLLSAEGIYFYYLPPRFTFFYGSLPRCIARCVNFSRAKENTASSSVFTFLQ